MTDKEEPPTPLIPLMKLPPELQNAVDLWGRKPAPPLPEDVQAIYRAKHPSPPTPPAPPPSPFPPPSSEEFKLLGRLATCCAASYKWDEEAFLKTCEQEGWRHPQMFRAKPGTFGLWLRAIVFLPVNYTLMAVGLAALIMLLVVIVFLTVHGLMHLATDHGLPPSVGIWLPRIGVAMVYLVLGSAVAGLAIAVIVAAWPWLASGRAFGFVEDKTATIIFCGSRPDNNLTINALALGSWSPLRHLGFLRAWRHIQPDIEEWLEDMVPEGAEIVITGHSLGGALTQLAAYDLSGRYRVRHAVSFGSSRIGGKTMRSDYQQAGLQAVTWHINRFGDTIPRLPPPVFFRHVGRRFRLSDAVGEKPGLLEEGHPEAISVGFGALHDRIVGATFRIISYLNNLVSNEKPAFGGTTTFPQTATLDQAKLDALARWITERVQLLFTRDIYLWPVYLAIPLIYILGMTLSFYAYYAEALLWTGLAAHRNKLYRNALDPTAKLRDHHQPPYQGLP